MKINRSALAKNYFYFDEEIIDFSSYPATDNVRSFGLATVKTNVCDYGDILRVEVEATTTVKAVCSYTLEDVELPLHFKEELEFSDDKEMIEQYIYVEQSMFELDPYIMGLIIANVPTRVIKKGAKLPSGGDGWRVLSEDDYLKEKESQTDSRWSKLDELDLD